MQQLVHFREWLTAIDPRLPAALLAVVVGGVVWAWRKYWPASFAKLPPRWQGLPAMLLGAVVAALSSGQDVIGAILEAAAGAGVGLAAVGGHHAVVKRLMGGGGEKAS